MGYVDIPAIKITLPVYHGTSSSVLQVAVGATAREDFIAHDDEAKNRW